MAAGNSPECEYCGKEFDNVGARLAHQRYKCEEAPETEEQDDKDAELTGATFDGSEYDFYAGEADELEVVDLDKPKGRCPNCSSPVRPGKNCEECGEELEWP